METECRGHKVVVLPEPCIISEHRCFLTRREGERGRGVSLKLILSALVVCSGLVCKPVNHKQLLHTACKWSFCWKEVSPCGGKQRAYCL